MNLGYETSGHRTLRSCGIDHRDLTSILTRAGVLPIGSEVKYGKYDFGMTIHQFLNSVEDEYTPKPIIKEEEKSNGRKRKATGAGIKEG